MTNSNDLKLETFEEIKDQLCSDERFTVEELSEHALKVTAKGKRKMNVIVCEEEDDHALLLVFNVSSNAARIMHSVAGFPTVAAIGEWVTGTIN